MVEPEPLHRSGQVRVLGVRVDPLDAAAVEAWLGEAIRGRSLRHLVTVNPEFVMLAHRNPQFASILERADLAVPDGAGVVWAIRRQGRACARVTGADLLPVVAAACVSAGCGLFLLGAREGVAAKVAERLRRQFPGLAVSARAGDAGPDGDAASLAAIAEAGPRALLVAYGAPAQELWIDRNRDRMPGVRLAMGVGGAFDFYAGEVPRAPAWMRGIGLEWLFRLAVQPWRWRRMLGLPRFALAVLAAGRG